MVRQRYVAILLTACALHLSIGTSRLLAQTIKFEVPAVVDPIHTNGEPDIGIDPSGRVFVSGRPEPVPSAAPGSARWTVATLSESSPPDHLRPRLPALSIRQAAETPI
jgi:hypothetical protein